MRRGQVPAAGRFKTVFRENFAEIPSSFPRKNESFLNPDDPPDICFAYAVITVEVIEVILTLQASCADERSLEPLARPEHTLVDVPKHQHPETPARSIDGGRSQLLHRRGSVIAKVIRDRMMVEHTNRSSHGFPRAQATPPPYLGASTGGPCDSSPHLHPCAHTNPSFP